MSEPINSIALVLAGALFGALAAGCWCGCLPRLRWRRQWRRLAGRNAAPFSDIPPGRTARFLAQQHAARNEERAQRIAREARL